MGESAEYFELTDKEREAVAWYAKHDKLRRGTKKRNQSLTKAEINFGKDFICGLLNGIEMSLQLVRINDEFDSGYHAGKEIRWQKKRDKQKKLAT